MSSRNNIEDLIARWEADWGIDISELEFNDLAERFRDKLSESKPIKDGPVEKRYYVEKTTGETNPDADYFVLRLDWGGDDMIWVEACRKAALVLSHEIEDHLPILAESMRDTYKLS